MSFAAGWYAVAIADGLEPGTSAGTRLFGKELVDLARRGRRAAMSGRIAARIAACGFPSASCAATTSPASIMAGSMSRPASAATSRRIRSSTSPDTIKVATYPTVEAMGMIWVYSQMVAEAPVAAPADGAATPVRSLYIDRAPEAVRAVILDNGGAGRSRCARASLLCSQCRGRRIAASRCSPSPRIGPHCISSAGGDVQPRRHRDLGRAAARGA